MRQQPDVPQFAFPLRFAGGQPVLVEQDTDDEVRDCVEVILRTRLRSRVDDPDMGISDPTFRAGVDLDEIRDAIADREPRAVALIGTRIDVEQMVREISVEVAARG